MLTANISECKDKCKYSHQVALLPHDSLCRRYLLRLEKPKLLLAGTVVFFIGPEELLSVSICGSLAHQSQNPDVLVSFLMHRETETRSTLIHQRGQGLPWESTAILCTADGYTHTYKHTISCSFIVLEWYYQGAQPEGFSISARLLLNWSMVHWLHSFRINNGGLMDALGGQTKPFF